MKVKEIRAVLTVGIYGRENSKQVVIVLFSIWFLNKKTTERRNVTRLKTAERRNVTMLEIGIQNYLRIWCICTEPITEIWGRGVLVDK